MALSPKNAIILRSLWIQENTYMIVFYNTGQVWRVVIFY